MGEDLPDGPFTMAIDPVEVWVCPVCGYTGTAWTGGLDVTISPYEGRYCMGCWAKWISENIPKMEKKP